LNKEIVTDPLDADDLWRDLRLNIASLQRLGVVEVLVLFGFAWGRFLNAGQWREVPLAIGHLDENVSFAEANRYGRLSDDNLYISIPKFKTRLQYSHESDIHLSYSEENDFVAIVLHRWVANHWLTLTPLPARNPSSRPKGVL
jgi:hypothetical protein